MRCYNSIIIKLVIKTDQAKNKKSESVKVARHSALFACDGGKMVKRADRDGVHRAAFDRARKKIYATQTVCGICGKPVDFSKKYPHPLSPSVDHIIPVAKGGHPSDPENLQLAHWTCNRQKSDKLQPKKIVQGLQEVISNRILPHSLDWKNFRNLNEEK